MSTIEDIILDSDRHHGFTFNEANPSLFFVGRVVRDHFDALLFVASTTAMTQL